MNVYISRLLRVVRNTIFRKAPPSVVSGYGKRSINLNKIVAVFEKHIFLSQTDLTNMQSFDITCNGITKLLKQLNPYKAPGPDNISPRILTELATDISPLLQLIFQKSLDTGVVPDDWRIANVSPVYKKGQMSLAENYRPISLTSVCCKTMEHILASKIMKHGEENNILYPL